MLKKIVSGGQTGVDRAALDASILCNIRHGGWCPRNRKAEDGKISSVYQLTETESDDYSIRTKLNIEDSDATLIFVPSIPLSVNDGTILTIETVKNSKKPYLIVNLSENNDQLVDDVTDWVVKNKVETLNVAGPRESQYNGIYEIAKGYLKKIFVNLINYEKNKKNELKYENCNIKIRSKL